ncbi:MAG: hypothetical protein U0M02_00680 [Acutalibacteraceae bacterium]|nr:hypothetical protein [Acutalibacteraceae bacterium]
MANFKKFMSIISAVALCISLVSCSGETTTKQSAVQTYSDEVATVIQTVYVQPETRKESFYNHVALQGAVIIEQDGRPYFKYKKKCELCGYISGGSTGTSASSGKLNSSFRCPDCGNQQKIQIETIRQ